jgi:hypothetical protein
VKELIDRPSSAAVTTITHAPLTRSQRRFANLDYLIGMVAVSLVLAASMIYWLDRLPRRVSQDYNEGWNALMTKRLFAGERLYPGTDTFLINNYPPLSFYIVGSLGRIVGDDIIAGRIISIVAFLAIAIAVGTIVWKSSGRRDAGVLSGLFFAAQFAVFPGGRIGLNDPQMLGHAVMTTALAALCCFPSSFAGVSIAALIVTVATLIKHNLIALPLAITTWLFVYDRLRFWAWLACLTLACAAVAAVCALLYGPQILDGLLMPRQMSASRLLKQLQTWLSLLEIPLTLWLAFAFVHRGKGMWSLVSLYIICSLLVAALFAGGAGVGTNVIYDALIGLSIAAGLIVAALDEAPALRAAVIMALCVALFLRMPSTPIALVTGTYPDLASSEREVKEDVSYLAARPGPVICENLALCYWAGKELAYDPFAMRQSFATGRRSESEFLETLSQKRYTVIQLEDFSMNRDDTRFSAAFMTALGKSYDLDRRSASGGFFLPKLH